MKVATNPEVASRKEWLVTTDSTAQKAARAARLVPAAVLLTETAVGSYWDLTRISYVREVFDRLGYPMYFATMLGAAKLAAIVAILAPGWPRTKEWAYAGLVFVYGGAAVSHIAVGDGPKKWAMPAFFATSTFATRAWMPSFGNNDKEHPGRSKRY